MASLFFCGSLQTGQSSHFATGIYFGLTNCCDRLKAFQQELDQDRFRYSRKSGSAAFRTFLVRETWEGQMDEIPVVVV